MNIYERDDIVVFYFIISKSDKTSIPVVKGWTDDKKLAEFYMKFHNCKKYSIAKVKKQYRDIVPDLNNNNNSEISIYSLKTRNRNKNKKDNDEFKVIQIPATLEEFEVLNDMKSGFCSRQIGYSEINSYIPYLKKRYKIALSEIGLIDVINSEIYGKNGEFVDNIIIDELLLLLRYFKDEFN